MAKNPSDREDNEDTNTDFVLPELPPHRPMVTDGTGQPRELTDYEMQKFEESRADTEMRRQAAAAPKAFPGQPSVIDQYRASLPRKAQPVDPTIVYGFDIPPSIHEGRVTSLTSGDGDEVLGYLKDATDFLSNTRNVLERIDAAYRLSMQDTTITPDARSARLEKEAGAAFTRAYEAHGKSLESMRKKITHTEGELNTPMTTAAATPRSNELRLVLRSLKPKEVNKAIRDAIAAEPRSPQQQELLSATLGAHALTVGIQEAEQAVHVRAYNEKTSPQVLRRLEILRKALAVVESVHPSTLRDTFQKSFRSSFTRASAIRGISEQAQTALSAINAQRAN